MSKLSKKNEKLALELASKIKTENDLNELSKLLLKLTVEKALNTEMDEHLGYKKNEISGNNTGNSRNGNSNKHIITDNGEILIETPRDRNSSFESQLIKKNQTRFTSYDSKILSLYARGMTTRDISDAFKEMYDVDISSSLISKVTDAVKEEVITWQNRPLDTVYPIVYLDCIVVKIQKDRRVINKSIYLALAVSMEGHKELLGLWLSDNEGSKFWMSVLTELKTRGIEDIFIACVDGLKGFPDAINTVFPKTKVQLCIVHMIRNSLRYVPYKDKKALVADLKNIYQAISAQEAEHALLKFAEKWDDKYPSISRSWTNNWNNIITLFDYPDEIRKIIYTTNAI